MKKNDVRNQLENLCENFRDLFQQLKENKQKKLEIENENRLLSEFVENERQKRQNTAAATSNKQKSELNGQLKLAQEILQDFHLSEQKLDQAINQSIQQLEKVRNDCRDSENEQKEMDKVIHDKTQQQAFLQQEVDYLNNQIGSLNDTEKHYEKAINDMTKELNVQKNKLNEQLHKIEEAEEQNSQLTQEEEQADIYLKTVQKELNGTIKASGQINKKIKDTQKSFDELSVKLNSKIERLKTQYKYNQQLNQNNKKIEPLKMSQMKSRWNEDQQDPSEEEKRNILAYKQDLISQLNCQKVEIENQEGVISQLHNEMEFLQQQFENYTFIPQEELKQLFKQHFLTQQNNPENIQNNPENNIQNIYDEENYDNNHEDDGQEHFFVDERNYQAANNQYRTGQEQNRQNRHGRMAGNQDQQQQRVAEEEEAVQQTKQQNNYQSAVALPDFKKDSDN